jgi:RNA polymerase sigma factor (sigma-70 family)
MREFLEQLLRAANVPTPEQVEALWAEYRADGPKAQAAFHTLLAWYGPAIYRRIWGFLRSDLAEDVLQDVLTKLHRKRTALASFTRDALPWLRATALRQCLDTYRRERRRKAREARRAVRPEGEAPAEAQLELQEMLLAALARLPRHHQDAVSRVFFEGQTRQDAARELGIHRDTLTDWLNVALGRLERWLRPQTVLAVGGMVSLPAVLEAAPLLPSPARLSELAEAAWVKAAASGSALWKLAAALLVGLVGIGGATLAASTWRGSPGGASVPVQPAEVPETLEARNRRVLETDTLPQVVEALQPLALNGGPMRVTHLEVHDFRAQFAIEPRPAEGAKGVAAMRFRIFLDTRTGHCSVHCDPRGRDEYRALNLDKPIIIRLPEWNVEFGVPVAALTTAVAILREFPPDPRAAKAAELHTKALRSALVPYCGVWRFHGEQAKRYKFATRLPDGPDDPVSIPLPHGTATATPVQLTLEPDGRVGQWGQPPFTLTNGGRRLEIPGTEDWWSREEIAP